MKTTKKLYRNRALIDFDHCSESKRCKNCSLIVRTACEDKLADEEYQRQNNRKS